MRVPRLVAVLSLVLSFFGAESGIADPGCLVGPIDVALMSGHHDGSNDRSSGGALPSTRCHRLCCTQSLNVPARYVLSLPLTHVSTDRFPNEADPDVIFCEREPPIPRMIG